MGTTVRATLVIFILVGSIVAAGPAVAQNYPTKPIRMIVPFPPGGTGEFLARGITPRMGEFIGQQFIVDFRGGAGTTLAAGLAAAAPADGYTVFIQAITTQAITETLYTKLPYDTRRDFASVGLIADVPLVLASHPSVPVRNAKDVADLSHTRAGKLDFASPGVGTSSHFAVELFKMVSKADLTHIPYKGAGQSTVDVMAGFVPLVIDSVAALKPHIDSGKLKGIAIGSLKRSDAAPQIATFAEAGYAGFEASAWWAILMPARTPATIITRLNTELNKTLEDNTVRTRFLSQGASINYGTPAQAHDKLMSELNKWAKVVKASGVRVD
jgi:tripartite-type tricarboxylate transporter receptor subunit TctC